MSGGMPGQPRALQRALRIARHALGGQGAPGAGLAPRGASGHSVARSDEPHGPLVTHFLAAPAGFAVVGASTARTKFGNRLLRCYHQHGKAVVPVSRKEAEIEGLRCVGSLQELPGPAAEYGISVVTAPEATLGVLREAQALGARRVWLQPGAESPEVLALAQELGLELLHSGPCVLKVLGFDDEWEPPRALAAGEEAEGAVRWRIDDRFVMTVTLANARKRNPLKHGVLASLLALLRRAEGEERERVRVVILEAEGPVFSSGHDFADFMAERGAAAHAETLALCTSVNLALQSIPQPTIAAVQGLATAGGCQLACSCDLVVASSAAAFQLPGAKGAGFCHTPAVSVAARASSPRHALELALLSEEVPAARAELMGLANRVVPPAELRGEVRRMAETISKVSPPHNMQLGKQTFYQQLSKATLQERYAVAEPVMLGMFADPVQQKKMGRFLSSRGGNKKNALVE